MNRLKVLGLVSVVAVAAMVAASWIDSTATTAGASAHRPEAGSTDRGPVAASGFTAARPAQGAAFVPTPVARARNGGKALSPVAAQFRSTRNLKSFADELLARRSALTHEERYYLAKALETCAFALSVNDDLAAASERRRSQFIASLSVSDPEAARRIAAYDAADDTQRCLAFQGERITQKEIEDLYRLAGDGGDPRAQARMLVAELNKSLSAPKSGGESTRAVASDDFQRIIGLLETRDAEAMVVVAQFLAQHRLIGELRIGANGEVPEPSSLVGAFSLVACDFEPTCPVLDREALQACAYAGYCSAESYETLYANFLASPWSYSQAMRYRSVIHSAIETRNWSLLGLQKIIGAKARSSTAGG